jgi:flavodoxin I
MPSILVLYYTQTNNTKKMADAVAEGAKNDGKVQVEVSYYVEPEELSKYDAIIVGSPTYHHDVPMDIKRLFEEAAVQGIALKGKIGATFGSYGWSGEAPKMVQEIMKNKFEMRVIEAPLALKYTPDEKGLDSCRALGKKVSETLIH